MYEARQKKQGKENRVIRNISYPSKQVYTIDERGETSAHFILNKIQPKAKILEKKSILSNSNILANAVVLKIIQKKNVSKIDAEDYKFFEDFLIKRVAYFMYKENPNNNDADKNYFEAEKIVRQQLEEEAKIAAYYKWKSDGEQQNQDQEIMDEQYFDALKSTIARHVLSTTEFSNHPETAKFISGMKSIGISEDEAKDIWRLILNGVKEQESQNKKAVYYDQDKKKSIFTSDLDVIRNQNKYYRELKEKIKHLLSVDIDANTNKQKLALWTGGYDLSDYAEKQGCKTLETTKLGKVIDNIYISDKWPLIGPLWNIISETFVEEFTNSAYQDKEVHVYIRAYDPASVLVRQEIDQIDPKIPIFWHCIGTQDNHDYMEIDNDGILSKTEKPARREDECLMRLWKFYRKKEKQGNKMKGGDVMVDKFKEVLNIDYYGMKESIAAKRYNEKILEQAYYLSEREKTNPADNVSIYFRVKEKVDEFIHKKSINYIDKIKKEAYRIWQRMGAHQNQSKDEQNKDWEAASIITVCNTDEFLNFTLFPALSDITSVKQQI